MPHEFHMALMRHKGNTMENYDKLHKTRFHGLFYTHNGDHWRFINGEDGDQHAVGPQYATKAELLGDLTRYAAEYGYDCLSTRTR